MRHMDAKSDLGSTKDVWPRLIEFSGSPGGDM